MFVRTAIFSAWIALSFAAAGCGRECRSSGMCSRGEHCDLASGECIGGCKSDMDCAQNTRCDLKFGNCTPMSIPGRADARTSTSADAS